MKVLIVQVGTPVNPNDFKPEQLIEQPTLLHGNQFFQYYEIVNNLQTRTSLSGYGNEVHFVYFTDRKSPLKVFKSAMQIRKLVRTHNIDLVNLYWGGISSLAAAIICPTSFVVSFLGSDIYGSYKPGGGKTFFGRILSLCSQLTGVFADGIIVMSNKMKQKIWAMNRAKVAVIPEGIDVQKFWPKNKQECRRRLGWDEQAPIFIFFSSAEGIYVKNLPLAKATLAHVQAHLPNAQMVLVHGVKHDALIDYYNAADALLLCSYHEGSNNSIKEALACNCPVVTVDVGDGRERLQQVHPSYVSEAFDPEELATSLVEILRSQKRSNGSEHVGEVSLAASGYKISEFYKTLAEKK